MFISGRFHLSWVTFQPTIVSRSVLALSPSVTSDQILDEVRQRKGWCHAASSLTGGQVCLLYSTLYWSLFTWPSLESPLLDPLLGSSSLDRLWSLLCSILYWSLLHLTIYWSLLVWVSYFPVYVQVVSCSVYRPSDLLLRWAELSWAELLCKLQSIIQSVLARDPLGHMTRF